MMRWIKRAVSAFLLASLVWMITTREGLTNLGPRILELNPLFLLLALALPWAALSSGVLRWKTLLRLEGIHLPFRWLLRSFLRGRFVGAFTPSTTGLDLYRLVDVAKDHSKAASGRVILVEKLYGLVALSMVTLMLLPLGVARFFGTAGLLMAAALGAVSVAGLFVLERPALLRRLPFSKAQKLADALGASRPSLGQRAELMTLGVVSHMATALVFVGTGLALGVEATPLELAIVGNAIVLATLLPVSVGGFGVREATAVALLGTVGVSTSDALLVGLLGYLVAQPPALVGGALIAARRTTAEAPAARPAPQEMLHPGPMAADTTFAGSPAPAP
ncbi:MAG: lysylphosphatidylglycerol synthase transmembrane domain-containing protein [Polyangiales bacterium]